MCGIVALFDPQARVETWAHARAMLELVRHRGPDGAGFAAFAKGDLVAKAHVERPASPGVGVDVVFGHRRLAIQDLSDRADQPMLDPSGRYCMIYNGEVYNFPELRGELESEDEHFVSTGDTEVVLRALTRWGVETAVRRFDGMYAILVLDRIEQRVFVARDPFGIKPLYYSWSPSGVLCFVSEIKQLTAHPEWAARLQPEAAWDYFARGVTDRDERTMFEGVSHVPVGGAGWIDLRELARGVLPFARWTMSTAHRRVPSVDSLREALKETVRRQLRADVEVGSCLSGGIDSSTIVSLAQRQLSAEDSEKRLQTFTARCEIAELDEWRYAEEVASNVGAEANSVGSSGESLWGSLSDLVWTQDEPFASPSIFLQAEVFRAARARGVKVMLDGQGADELFCGYHTFFKVWMWELARWGRWGELRRLCSGLRRVHGYRAMSLLAKLAAAATPTIVARPASAWSKRVRLAASIFDTERLGVSPHDPLARDGARRKGVREYSVEQLQRTSAPMLLRWEDRNSMAQSIEARVPFLSLPLVEEGLSFEAESKLGGGETKRVLREAIRELVPESVRTRQDKIAFVAPEAEWMGVAAAATGVEAALESALASADPWLRPGGIERLRAMAGGDRGYDNVLWRAVSFGAWVQRFGVRGG